jgi:hypothetical protein
MHEKFKLTYTSESEFFAHQTHIHLYWFVWHPIPYNKTNAFFCNLYALCIKLVIYVTSGYP